MRSSSPEAPIKFSKTFLPQVRLLANNCEPTVSGHAAGQMIERGITMKNVQDVLKSPTNQVLEIQSPCAIPGKSHKDERILIFDPQYTMPLIIVCSIVMEEGIPIIYLVTTELVDDHKWTLSGKDNPWLIRNPNNAIH